jgi:hypothetical protein
MSLFPRGSSVQQMTCIAVIGAALVAASSSSVNAQQPPWEGCRAASKTEYDSAKSQYLLRNAFGMYVRTRQLWRRYYWYCHL